ncbi:hypothetical protein TRFO_06108 [Tritrichomonas foetus]|uniref:Uncharacterized protein n=1 Tax=Tritrichomonas foetus TaxID=1144522 RepID=A0A1J4K2R0_9EUKA|nr:hypothetical protein TRFO_06108 [Tritrichomonas foetus]|eukprot:OHT05096.1 hypothetical protein TRFO_06108 [Tritrichomonas foetus]
MFPLKHQLSPVRLLTPLCTPRHHRSFQSLIWTDSHILKSLSIHLASSQDSMSTSSNKGSSHTTFNIVTPSDPPSSQPAQGSPQGHLKTSSSVQMPSFSLSLAPLSPNPFSYQKQKMTKIRQLFGEDFPAFSTHHQPSHSLTQRCPLLQNTASSPIPSKTKTQQISSDSALEAATTRKTKLKRSKASPKPSFSILFDSENSRHYPESCQFLLEHMLLKVYATSPSIKPRTSTSSMF